ncbi:hypothetical protein L9G15_19295 [Shewanella sp. A3A]|nr:hypothetical protein [Shewanella ferrihydritica]
MDINTAFSELKNEFEAISYQERKTREIFKKMLEDNSRSIDLIEAKHGDDSSFGSSHNMWFERADNREIVGYGRMRLSHKDIRSLLIKQRNRQYQWLLAEAYEAYEDFIEKVCAVVGARDATLWNNKQKLKLENAIGYQMIIDTIRKSTSEFSSMKLLKSLRNRFDQIKQLEKNNAFKSDLRFFLSLIEQLRHQIVHTKGIIGNTNLFFKRVLKGIGLSRSTEWENRIRFYLDEHIDGTAVIFLSDRPVNENSILPQYINVIDHLISMLLSHALIVVEATEGGLFGKDGN